MHLQHQTTLKLLHFAFVLSLLTFYHDICNCNGGKLSYTRPIISTLEIEYKLFSSVWCRGSNHTDRFCHFKNMCYKPSVKEFVFLKSSESIISGVPSDRFNPSLADFSSVIDHNRMYFNYVEIPYLNALNFDFLVLPGCALILKRFNPDNLMHVFHDDLLPVFYTSKEIPSDTCKAIYMVFADDRLPGNYSFLYEHFFMSKPIYLNQLDGNKLYCFSDSYIGLNKYTVWYQYGFKTPQGPVAKNYNGMSNVIQKFVLYFKLQFGIPKHEVNPEIAVLLTRKYSRKILNEEVLINTVKSYTNLKTLTAGLESFDVLYIIELITQCKVLIGMHGSLLILSMFLSPGSVLIELFPYAISPSYYTPYKTLVTFPGSSITYSSWENKDKSNSVPPSENPAELGGIHHLPVEEQIRIEQTSVVYPQMCCYSPEWLYFIYQDTIVDLNSLLENLQNALQQTESMIKEHMRNREDLLESDICPGEVRDLTCFETERNVFYLSWSLPWNLNFIRYKSLEYEIWLQSTETANVSAYITKKNHFAIAVSNHLFYVWIRCLRDGCTGPFNSDPLLCQQ